MYIISGKFKGRKLLPPPASSITRPITGLVKKSLFDSLNPFLADALVLDLFCGTGTMGLEALSRGASSCFFAEFDPAVIERLRQNVHSLELDSCTKIWRGDINDKLRSWLGELDKPADVAFVDPPYANVRKWDWQKAATNIFDPISERLAEQGLVILRSPAEVPVPPMVGTLKLHRLRKHGSMHVAILCHPEAAE